MPLEIERKYLDAPLAKIRERLQNIDATHLGANFESNRVFDTPDLQLCEQEKLLRLRCQQWRDRTNIILTYKSPPEQQAKNCKIREELEVGITDMEIMAQILHDLGYMEAGRYEKFRDCWLVSCACLEKRCGPTAEHGEMKIFLDLLPFGQVVEIESDLESAGCLDNLLGLDNLQTSTKSYYALYQDWCRVHEVAPEPGFAFDERDRARLLAQYNIAIK